MSGIETLDNTILELFVNVYRNDPKRELRWFEIRNSMLMDDDVPLEARKNVQAFSVKLSRKLDVLVRQGILVKHDRAHKDVTYSLAPDYRLNILKERGLLSYTITSPLDVRPDESMSSPLFTLLPQLLQRDPLHERSSHAHHNNAWNNKEPHSSHNHSQQKQH